LNRRKKIALFWRVKRLTDRNDLAGAKAAIDAAHEKEAPL